MGKAFTSDAQKTLQVRCLDISVEAGDNPSFPSAKIFIDWENTETGRQYHNTLYSYDLREDLKPTQLSDNPGRRLQIELNKLGIEIFPYLADEDDIKDGLEPGEIVLQGQGLTYLIGAVFNAEFINLGYNRKAGTYFWTDVIMPKELVAPGGAPAPMTAPAPMAGGAGPAATARAAATAPKDAADAADAADAVDADAPGLDEVPFEILCRAAFVAQGKLSRTSALMAVRNDAVVREAMNTYPALRLAVMTNRDLFARLQDLGIVVVGADDRVQYLLTELSF